MAQGNSTDVRCHGRIGRSPSAPDCTPDTVFEIGSVTKTFTALLLATMAARGELSLDDPLELHLPGSWAPLTVRSGGPIRLLHLATHTSGLNRLPPGLLTGAVRAWYSNPYGAFGESELREAIARTTVRGRPGTRYGYSNYGVALLGRLLAETGGAPYAELLSERIGRPLGLRSLTCAPDAPDRAIGHRRGRALPPWRMPGLPGAGAVRASGADLLRFLRAHVGTWRGEAGEELGAALREVQLPRLRLPRSGDEVCLVWNHRRAGDRDLFFHSGATRGFTAFVGFSPQTETAVATLANTGPTMDGRFLRAGYEVLTEVAGNN
ncbi:serine hydrolase [Streptomyces sp. SP17BM10]|uniref:serine hydrolase domain-containing protein n=1 Tax=Streptomyces sp. SP17BM10 TaxID=3002530 RepID=UPI002E77EAC8|nr:serine hydrolase domain-containing protein [Streptomyces sp. SP17BM10]MEE1787485.1 serine hydrolase [Streptomyces sp. SP17BM10]